MTYLAGDETNQSDYVALLEKLHLTENHQIPTVSGVLKAGASVKQQVKQASIGFTGRSVSLMDDLREASIFPNQAIDRFIEGDCKAVMIIANDFSEDLNHIVESKQWKFERD